MVGSTPTRFRHICCIANGLRGVEWANVGNKNKKR